MDTIDAQHVWQPLAADLRRFVQKRIRDPHTAEDLVQDVFVKFAQHLKQGPHTAPLHAWVFRTAQNTIVDHYRRQRPESAETEHLPAEPPRGTSLEDEPLCTSFRSFLQALPAEQRQAIERTEYDGLTQVQLAAELSVPVSTVKSRVQRGKQRLHRALLDCCSFEFDRRGQLLDWQRRPGGGCQDCS